jgi:hypothetical protein
MHKRAPTPIGQKFGKLTVVGDATTVHSLRRVSCKCDCGKFHVVVLADLKRSHVQSCGCLGGKLRHGHGRRGRFTTEYSTWAGMIQRCTNPSAHCYDRYGGSGITVCERWKDFANFLEDMGLKPSPDRTLDRIDPHKGYCPENCRWATPKEQARNRKDAVWVEVNGEKLRIWEAAQKTGIRESALRSRAHSGKPASDLPRGWMVAFGRTQSREAWSKETGVPSRVILARLQHGWRPERAVSQPVRKWGDLYT